jgi:hypothetical protein
LAGANADSMGAAGLAMWLLDNTPQRSDSTMWLLLLLPMAVIVAVVGGVAVVHGGAINSKVHVSSTTSIGPEVECDLV